MKLIDKLDMYLDEANQKIEGIKKYLLKNYTNITKKAAMQTLKGMYKPQDVAKAHDGIDWESHRANEECPGDKIKSKGKGKGLGKGKGKGPIGRFKEEEDDLDEADANKFVAYMNDPLYKAVFSSGNKKDFDKAIKTLKAIRGESAFNDFLRMMQK